MQKNVTVDEFGRETMYINELEINEKPHLLHFMLGWKGLVFLAFWLTTGAYIHSLIIVWSDLGCDASHDCYVLDTEYCELPIANCSEVLNNENLTAVCYILVFDLTQACSATTLDGLLTSCLLKHYSVSKVF